MKLTELEMELLRLVIADYLDNLDASLDDKLLHIYKKIEQLNSKTWTGLTETEQDAVFKTFHKSEAFTRNFLNRVATAIENKFKEKNHV